MMKKLSSNRRIEKTSNQNNTSSSIVGGQYSGNKAQISLADPNLIESNSLLNNTISPQNIQ